MSDPAVRFSNTGNGYTIVTQVIASPTGTQQTVSSGGPLQKFLKGEPKALGTVQIMIGLLTFLFGIVMSMNDQVALPVFSGICFWGGLLYIVSGSLAVSASNKLHLCVVKGALTMNVISAISSAIAIILLILELLLNICYCGYYYGCRCNDHAIVGVLLVFSILQFIISICISAFTCNATCTNEPVVNVTVVSNQDRCFPAANSLPAQNTQQWMYGVNGATMNSPPMESPPEYTETKCHSEN